MSIADYIALLDSSQRAYDEIATGITILKNIKNGEQAQKSINTRIQILEVLQSEIEAYRLVVNTFKEQQKVYYAIRASPSKSNHVAHIVCYFSSLENAQKYLVPSSTDSDNNCTWYYSIEVVTTTPMDLSKLDRPSSNYPYTGW
jgi:hypothetical protein